MKKLSLIIVAALSLFFSACLKTDDNCCVVPFQPFIGYEVNSVRLYGDVSSAKVGTDSISVISNRQDSKLVMHIKYNGKGSYTLTGNQARLDIRSGLSGTPVSYNAKTGVTNTLEVTEVDSLQKLIAGKFKITFKKSSATSPGTSPDSIVVKNGQFQLALPR